MISLVIAYYKNLPALELLLQGYNQQSEKNFEIIVAEDAQDHETIEFLNHWRKKSQLNIQHVSQADTGFRKTKILNKAIAASKGNFLVFTDGDCIPHKHFIRAYKNAQQEGFVLFGRRVMLNENFTNKLLKGGSIEKIKLSTIMTNAKKIKYSLYLPFLNHERKKGILGCNWGVPKKELVAVNGFDEAYTQAGVGEDVDIEWTLLQNGVRLKSVRFAAIVYHLYHKAHYNEVEVNKGFAILNEKKRKANIKN